MYGAAKCRAIFTAVNNRLSAREVLATLAAPRSAWSASAAAAGRDNLSSPWSRPGTRSLAWMPQPC